MPLIAPQNAQYRELKGWSIGKAWGLCGAGA
jgi:hypothetical protein